MIIKQMAASFGRLQNASLTLEEGFNLIEAPNEAGKSTWSAFLRAMFYGIPTKERDRQGFLAEKNRYQPWSGLPMEGRIDLIWRGQAITLRRSARNNIPFGTFEAVDTATGAPIPGLTGQNVGETLLGVPREVFERSAFVGQGAAAVDGTPALEKRIAALVSSGEEEVSPSQVRQQLRDWQNRRRHNKTGLIPKLEEELAGLEQTIERQNRAHRMAEEARQEVAALTAEKAQLEGALAASRQAENELRRQKYEAAQQALAQAEAEAKAIHADLTRQGTPPGQEALRAAQEDLNYLNTLSANIKLAESQRETARAQAEAARLQAEDPCFSRLSAQEAQEQANRDAKQVNELLSQAEAPSSFRLLGLAILILSAALLVLAFVKSSFLIGGLGLALLAADAVYTLLRTRRQTRLQTDAQNLLDRYQADSPDGILDRAAHYQSKQETARQAEQKRADLETSLAQMAAQRIELRAALLDLVHPFAPTVSDVFGISAAISRALALEDKLATALMRRETAKTLVESLPKPDAAVPGRATALPQDNRDPKAISMRLSAVDQELVRRSSVLAMAKGELNTLGDPALFQARRERVKEELARRSQEYDALTLALECLEQSDTQIQSRFSPVLNQRAGEIAAALTGGKYNTVTLTKDFEASAGEAGGVTPRRSLTLSKGTVDQLYLAVRLAVCQLALPSEDPPPLILDDALTNFDDKRTALALRYLLELSASQQVLLFTCHSREGRLLEGEPGVHRPCNSAWDAL
ncbi:MAG: AAA family ATPase [Oscillospiraceae bacterium]|nr:AAA family ATPase [Oscillospiraceae bacterium]